MAPKSTKKKDPVRYHLQEDSASCNPEDFNEGDVIEVLDLAGVEGLSTSRGVFWVEAVELSDGSGITLKVASLGGDDQASSALLATIFNRKKARLHLCFSTEGPTACKLDGLGIGGHCSQVHKYALSDYPVKAADPSVARAVRHRRRDLDRKKGKGGREASSSRERSPRREREEDERPGALRKPGQKRSREEEHEVDEDPAGGVWERARSLREEDNRREEIEEHHPREEAGEELDGPGARPALRAALGKLKARLGRPSKEGRNGAGAGGEPFDVFRPPQGELKKKEKREALEDTPDVKRRATEAGEDIRGTTTKPSKKEAEEKEDRPPGGVLAELVHKASKPPKKKRASQKKSKSKKTAMALMQTLAKGLGLKTYKNP